MGFQDLIIIGNASDGPEGIPMLLSSMDDVENTFGWWQNDYVSIASTAASAALNYSVWGNQLLVYKRINNKLIEDKLYNVTVQGSGNYVTFGQPGASGEYLFRYIRQPAQNNIVWAAKNVIDQGSSIPWLYRLPGTKSSIIIGDLLFKAEYSGSRYNNIQIVVNSNTIRIYWTLDYSSSGYVSYSTTQDSLLLTNSINNDHYFGKHPLLATCYSTTPSIPSGTYYTMGGNSGSITETSIADAISSLDLDNTGIILIAGNNPESISSTALSIITSQDQVTGPACLVVSSPSGTINMDSSTYKSYLDNLTYNSNKLHYVPGWGTSTTTAVPGAVFPLSFVFAGLLSSYSSAPTNKKTTLNSFTPVWDKDQLIDLSDNFFVFNRFISNGISVWRSSPTNGENPLINKVKIDIAKRISGVFDSVIGEPGINADVVLTMVNQALNGLQNIRNINYSCEVGPSYIIIRINLRVYGEIQNISLSLVSRKPNG